MEHDNETPAWGCVTLPSLWSQRLTNRFYAESTLVGMIYKSDLEKPIIEKIKTIRRDTYRSIIWNLDQHRIEMAKRIAGDDWPEYY